MSPHDQGHSSKPELTLRFGNLTTSRLNSLRTLLYYPKPSPLSRHTQFTVRLELPSGLLARAQIHYAITAFTKRQPFYVGRVLPRIVPFSAELSDIELHITPRHKHILAALNTIQKSINMPNVFEFEGAMLFLRQGKIQAEETYKKLQSAFPEGLELGKAIGYQLVNTKGQDGHDRPQTKYWFYWFQNVPQAEKDPHNLATYRFRTSEPYIESAEDLFDRY